MTEESDSDVKEPIETESDSSTNHDQSSQQDIPVDTSKPKSRADKFSKRIQQCPSDELKIFEENSLIGSGGFGSVRKYHHKEKIVAVKEFAIKGEDEVISKIWNMVRREANILCRFQHENIVEILGITRWPNTIGIIMEYIDGGNLQDFLTKDDHPKLSWDTRLKIAKGITSALDYIHNYGEKKTFCHGDLKPANILLKKRDLKVKLADFGSAAFYRATAASTTTINTVSSKQFTLSYVAPEFLEDTTLAKKPPMDMYSFGLILYGLIGGQEPYADCGIPALVPSLILSKQKPSDKCIDHAESQLKSHNDRAAFRVLKKLMEKCWNSDPRSRPRSKTVKEALSQYLNQQRQSSTVPNYGIETVGVGATARERKNATVPTVIALHKPDVTSTLSTSVSQSSFRKDQSSVDIVLPNQTSRKTTPLTKVFKASGQYVTIGTSTSVRDLLEKYANCLLSKKFEEGEIANTSLCTLIEKNFNARAEDATEFAEKLQEEKRYLESVAIFNAAAALFARMKNPEEDLEKIQSCIQGMKEAVKQMIEIDANRKIIARKHVIPLMHHWLRQMQGMTQVSEKWLCHTTSWALSNIEVCELWVELWDERRRTLEEAVSGMRSVFGRDAHKVHGRLFGTLLNNLGVAYKRESRLEEARAFYQESIAAHREAVDYFGNEKEREDDIRISEQNLRSCMKTAWEKQLQMKR